jgi:hypothetical protein
MELIAQLGSILGLSFISGINLYATVAVVGICTRFDLIQGLPPEFQVLSNEAVIFVALLLYFVEFFMDKIQGLDTLWDSLHTIIRPLGGAFIALMQVGEASLAVEVIVFMLGASLASAAHITKAGTRLVVNASPEPVSNILVSLGEDIGVVGFSFLTMAYPKLSFFLTLIFLGFILFFLPLLFRTLRMLFGSLFFRIRSFFLRDVKKSSLLSLPYSFDTFFDEKKEKDEEIIWSVRAFSVRIPSVRRFTRMYMVITSKTLYCIYRHWFRFKIRQLARSDIRQLKCYPGRLLAKCLIKTSGETWLVQLYQPLSKTLPDNLELGNETG